MAVAPSHLDDVPHVAELLYERHAAALRAFCRARVGADEADEVVQTTFLRALRALNRGERPYAERAWLLTIARRVCATRATTAARRHEVFGSDALDVAAAPASDDYVEADLATALAALPEGQRRAFVLRAVHDLSYDEIAAELGVSHAAVESWIFRARRKLADAVGERRRLALDTSSLASLLKSLMGGTAVKAAAVTVAAVGAAAVAGPAIVGRLADDPTPRAPAPARQLQAPPGEPRTAPPAPRTQRTPATSRGGEPRAKAPSGTSPGAPLPSAPSAPSGSADPPAVRVSTPEPDAAELPALDPAVALPSADLPALDVPTVDLPPVGQLDPPAIDLPAVDPPALTLPEVDPPAVDSADLLP